MPTIAAILSVADRLKPFHVAAVQRFMDGDVRHRRIRAGSVPVLLAGRYPDGIARVDRLNGFAFLLDEARTGDDVQRMSEGVRVPVCPRARIEANYQRANACRRFGFDDRVLPNRAGEIV